MRDDDRTDIGAELDGAIARLENLTDRLRQYRGRAADEPDAALAGLRAVAMDLGRLAEQYGA